MLDEAGYRAVGGLATHARPPAHGKVRVDPAFCQVEPNRFGAGYVTSTFTGLGGTWLVIDWDAIRLPGALTTR